MLESWRYRELIWFLVRRELTVRYRRSLLGVSWVVLQPVAFALIFAAIITTRSDWFPVSGISVVTSLYMGLSLWQFFESALTGATLTLVANQQLVKNVSLPRKALLMSAVLVRLPDLLINLCLFVMIMLVTGSGLSVIWLLKLPVAVALLGFFAYALATLLAPVNVFRRDISHALPVAMRFLFIASPFWYSLQMLPDWLHRLMLVNPVVVSIEMCKRALTGEVALRTWEYLPAVIVIVVTIVSGHAVFRRLDGRLADGL